MTIIFTRIILNCSIWRKAQVNVGCHTDKQYCPATDLFLVKMHVNMQNWSVPYQSQMCSPFLESFQNNLEKMEIQGTILFS